MSKKKWTKYFMPGWWHAKQARKTKISQLRQIHGDDCWRCNDPMRFGPPFNTRGSATVEHLCALSNGGTWAMDNLRLCHKECNEHLGTNPVEMKERMRTNQSPGARNLSA